jgi:hypothetical protein
MKKILLAFIIAGVLAGCHKGSDPTPDTGASTKIIGKWSEGPALLIYYVSGNEVYRENDAATSSTLAYDEFRTNGVWADYTFLGTAFYEIDGTYTLKNNGNTITLSIQGQNQDYAISFADANTINISATVNVATTYIKNGQTYTADSETVNATLLRIP